jgi:hypothetical protein
MANGFVQQSLRLKSVRREIIPFLSLLLVLEFIIVKEKEKMESVLMMVTTKNLMNKFLFILQKLLNF